MSEDRDLTLPTTSDIRWWWGEGVAEGVTKDSALRQFDRWLAEHDRQVAEKAWEDGERAGADNENMRLVGPVPTAVKRNPYRASSNTRPEGGTQ